MFSRCCFLLLSILSPLTVHAQLHLLARVGEAEAAQTSLVSMRLDEKCELVAVLQRDGHYFSDAAGSARIGEKRVVLEPWPAALPSPAIHWFKVEPVMKHADKGNDPTVPRFLWYTNAYTPGSPTGRQRWIGFDKVSYRNNPLLQFDGQWRIPADAQPTDPAYNTSQGRGTMRYALEIKLGEKTWRTPDASSTNYLGMEDSVLKILVREDDSFVGHATSWCNVPGIFGSHELQVDRHIGVDCADLIVGAYRQWKHSKIDYTGVNGLPDLMEKVGKPVYLAPSGKIFAAADQKDPAAPPFERGMAVMINYPDTVENWYNHVAILYKDNGNGVLDGEDLTLECGPMEPRFAHLKRQSLWPGKTTRLQLLRWR